MGWRSVLLEDIVVFYFFLKTSNPLSIFLLLTPIKILLRYVGLLFSEYFGLSWVPLLEGLDVYPAFPRCRGSLREQLGNKKESENNTRFSDLIKT